MIGENDSNYLIDYNASNWADVANQQLQNALTQGLQYSKQYSQQAVDALQGAQQQSRADMQQGFERGQALTAPQRLAGYTALDTYQDMLGLARPVGGSFQLASGLENLATGQPNASPQQQQQALGFNQGLLNNTGV